LISLIFYRIGNVLEGNFSLFFNRIASIGFLISSIIVLITLFLTWLEYSSYGFFLDENSFKVRRGIIQKEEISIPYRQIQSVNIKRSLFDQIIGINKLIILTAGTEDKEEKIKTESEAILPAIDKNLAQKIQEELLRRANIEQVIIK